MKTLIAAFLAFSTLSAFAAGECRLREVKEVNEMWNRVAVTVKTVEAQTFNDCIDLGQELLGSKSIGSYSYRRGGRRGRYVTLTDARFETVKVKIKFTDEAGETHRAKLKL